MLQRITLFGWTINLYDFFNNAAYFGQFLVALYIRRDFAAAATLPKLANLYLNKKKKDTLFWRWAFVWLLGLVFFFVVAIVNNRTGSSLTKLFLGTADANFFPNIFVGPITVLLLSVLLRNSPLITLDLAAPIAAIALVFYKIACFCWGCCNGIAWEHGLYNAKTERIEFPVQLVEIICAMVMLTILLMLLRKKDLRHGILYPLFMLMYCSSRFVSEFWRDDYPDIWGPFKSYHLQCAIGFVEGAILLAVVLIWGKQITAYFEAKNQALLDRHTEMLRSRYHHKKKKKK